MLLVKPGSIASRYLDALRFLAALIVLFCHAMGNDRIPGHQAVMVFFVLSGYLVGATVYRSIREKRWSWTTYLIHRLTRLWIVLLPALLLTLFWTKLQQELFGQAALAGANDWQTLLGNVFFLQEIEFSVYGHNTPLWSLSYEFWYYVLFPCLLLAVFSRTWTARVFYACCFVGLAVFLGKHVVVYFLIWLLGALLSFLRPVRLRGFARSFAFGATAAAAASSMTLVAVFGPPLGVIRPLPQFLSDLSIGLSFAALIYLLLCHGEWPAARHRLLDACKYAAGFSYTLYLVHEPILDFLIAARTVDGSLLNTQLPWLRIGLKIVIFFGIVAYAWALSRVTEAHTDKVRKRVAALMGITKTPVRASAPGA